MYDPFRGYDQWKTASPYDDEMPVLEGLIPEFPVICPCCQEMAEWFQHETPGDDEFAPETECGWHCDSCDWTQEADPYDRKNDATVPYREQINAMYERWREAKNNARKNPPPVLTLADLDLPEDDFDWSDVEAGDWHVYCCGEDDCPVKWHRIAYACNFKREDGMLTIESVSVDEDGNWDFDDAWSSDDETPWEETWLAKEMATQANDFFVGWAEYWIHCAETMTDPVNDAIEGPHTMTPAKWIEFCLKSAENCVEVLERA